MLPSCSTRNRDCPRAALYNFARGFVDNFEGHTAVGRFIHLCAAVRIVIRQIQCRHFNCFCTVWFQSMYLIDRQRGARTCQFHRETPLRCLLCCPPLVASYEGASWLKADKAQAERCGLVHGQ